MQPARTVPDDAAILGIDRFTNGMPAFVACSAEPPIEEWVFSSAALREPAPQPTRTRTNCREEWDSTKHFGLDFPLVILNSVSSHFSNVTQMVEENPR